MSETNNCCRKKFKVEKKANFAIKIADNVKRSKLNMKTVLSTTKKSEIASTYMFKTDAYLIVGAINHLYIAMDKVRAQHMNQKLIIQQEFQYTSYQIETEMPKGIRTYQQKNLLHSILNHVIKLIELVSLPLTKI